MEVTDAAVAINWLAVLIAALSSFMLGGIWYGPLFEKAWIQSLNLNADDLAKRKMPMVFGLAFLAMLIAAINLEMFIGAEATLAFGSFAGFAAGLGWVSTFLGTQYLFENRSLRGFLINAGYCTLALTLMGAILGAW